MERGFTVTVVDIAGSVLDMAKSRTGADSDHLSWVEADVTEVRLDSLPFDTWHDRAVLHFLLDAPAQDKYVATLKHHLIVGGHAIIGTFAPSGPDRCSGLPVQRYSPEDLAQLLGEDFTAVEDLSVMHATPNGTDQAFTFGVFARRR